MLSAVRWPTLITLLTLTACSSGAGTTLNPPTVDTLPGGIVVDSRGRIFVLDRKPTLIKVYASDGTFNGTIGREGSGPGEFQQWGILTIRRDTLYHHDPRQVRTQAFTPDGALIHG